MAGLRGNLSVTFEEGTWAAWLYDVLKPHVAHLVVCNPRKNALLKAGSKSDRIDARKLAELLRGNHLKPVYHGETGVRMLRELARIAPSGNCGPTADWPWKFTPAGSTATAKGNCSARRSWSPFAA
jgi:hypothetical protein